MKITHWTLFLIFTISLIAAFPRVSPAETVANEDSLLKARKHFSFAVQYKKSKNFDNAAANYKQSIAFNDTVYQVHYSFADLLMQMERPADAKHEFALSLKLNPDHYNSASMLANLHYESAHYDSALAMYETMYRIKPDDTAILSSIAALRDYLGLKESALSAYQKMVENGDSTKDTLLKTVSLAMSLGKWNVAGDYARTALETYPGDRDFLKAASRISRENSDTAASTGYLRTLADADSTDTNTLFKLEQAYRSSGETENLIWTLNRLLMLTPNDSRIAGDLAELLIGVGKIDSAISHLTECIERTPENGKYHILLGNCYSDLGETEKALTEYRLALSDDQWKSSAQQFIWKINPPESEEEKKERDFFQRGQETKKKQP